MGFRILASAILPLSSLIGPTLLFVLAQGAGVVLVLKGVFRTGSEFEVHLKVIAMSVAIIGGVVFGSKLLDQAIRDKADAEKKTEVLLCQAKVSYAFTNPKEAERWCSVERNRTNLK